MSSEAERYFTDDVIKHCNLEKFIKKHVDSFIMNHQLIAHYFEEKERVMTSVLENEIRAQIEASFNRCLDDKIEKIVRISVRDFFIYMSNLADREE